MPRLDNSLDRFRDAMALHRAGALQQAEAIYRELLREDPEHAGAWHLLGVVLHSRQDLSGALEHIEKALALCSTKATYFNNYGVVLRDMGHTEKAKSAFQKAVALRDRYADGWSNLGMVQCEMGELELAERSLRYALQIAPHHVDTLCHLAVLCREKGSLREALRICQDAATIAPAEAQIYEIQGAALAGLKRLDEAVVAFERALPLDRSSARAHLNLAAAYSECDEIGKAREHYDRAASLRPDRKIWQLKHLSLCPTVFRNNEEITEYRRRLEEGLDEALADPLPLDWRQALQDGFIPPFQLSHHSEDSRRLKEKFARLFAPHFPDARPKPLERETLRIGFTCTHGHEGGFLRGFGGIMQQLNRSRFEVVGLVSRSIVPFCRQKLRSGDIAWVGFSHHMERTLQAFQQSECDVVVHWTPGTDLMNYFLPFLPLAPTQCIGFGMHGTTGIENLDYCVSSSLFERGEESAKDYTETLVQFESATCWQERPRPTKPATRADFGLPASGSLYFCPQRLAKFHPDFDTVIARILDRDPHGYVCVLAGLCPRSRQTLKQRFSQSIDATLGSRILFVPTQTGDNYLRLLSVMDVVLDMPSYSAALTGYDALGLGVPIVTLPGRYMVERYAFGLYKQMGFQELLASTSEQYIDLAVRLGRDRDFRQRMSQQILACSDVLFRNPLAIQEYEDFFSNVARVSSAR